MSYPAIKTPRSVKVTPVDNTLRSPTDAGYVLARPRTSRAIYDFDVELTLDAADLELLKAHDASVTGATIFPWTNPLDGVTYQVRYTKRISWARRIPGWFDVSYTVQSV